MGKVGTIAFSLYGAGHKYTLGAIANAELAARHFPGWACRYYCSASVPEWAIRRLESYPHVEIHACEDGMFGRFRAAFEGGVTIIRDADSRLGPRDARVVGDWLESGRRLLVIRDHPAHIKPRAPIFGGLWGFRGRLLDGDLGRLEPSAEYGHDLVWLRQHVWDSHRRDHFAADFREVPWMAERVPDFLGQVYEYGFPVYLPDSCERFPPEPERGHLGVLARLIESTSGPILELGARWRASSLIGLMAAPGRPRVSSGCWPRPAREAGSLGMPTAGSGRSDWSLGDCDEFPSWSVALVDQIPPPGRTESIRALSGTCEHIVVCSRGRPGSSSDRTAGPFRYRYEDPLAPGLEVLSNLAPFAPQR